MLVYHTTMEHMNWYAGVPSAMEWITDSWVCRSSCLPTRIALLSVSGLGLNSRASSCFFFFFNTCISPYFSRFTFFFLIHVYLLIFLDLLFFFTWIYLYVFTSSFIADCVSVVRSGCIILGMFLFYFCSVSSCPLALAAQSSPGNNWRVSWHWDGSDGRMSRQTSEQWRCSDLTTSYPFSVLHCWSRCQYCTIPFVLVRLFQGASSIAIGTEDAHMKSSWIGPQVCTAHSSSCRLWGGGNQSLTFHYLTGLFSLSSWRWRQWYWSHPSTGKTTLWLLSSWRMDTYRTPFIKIQGSISSIGSRWCDSAFQPSLSCSC